MESIHTEIQPQVLNLVENRNKLIKSLSHLHEIFQDNLNHMTVEDLNAATVYHNLFRNSEYLDKFKIWDIPKRSDQNQEELCLSDPET